MTKAIARDPIYRGRRFQPETIELCVRWYITYRLSYRDLVAMMAEWGIAVSHTTILRWVLRYVPEFERRWARYARRVNSSWRIDETSIAVRGRWHYLYRAVDKHGKVRGPPSACGSRHRCCTGLLPPSCGHAPATMAAQGES
jgi:transposase-like protein